EGWHLVGDRLSTTGGHQHHGIPTADHVLDDVGLIAAEGVVTEDGAEGVKGGRVLRRRRAGDDRGGCRGGGRCPHRRHRRGTPVERWYPAVFRRHPVEVFR